MYLSILKVTGGMKGSDERDVIFGRLFGFLALIRSGRLRDDSAIGTYFFNCRDKIL
jgi:hypothetical protein